MYRRPEFLRLNFMDRWISVWMNRCFQFTQLPRIGYLKSACTSSVQFSNKILSEHVVRHNQSTVLIIWFARKAQWRILSQFFREWPWCELPRRMWFQNDVAPCHYYGPVRTHLTQQFSRWWIGRKGPIEWPARSLDLNPIDFFVSPQKNRFLQSNPRYFAEIVYAQEDNSEQELRNRLRQVQVQMENKPEPFRKLRNIFLKRCWACIQANGGHFEHLLYVLSERINIFFFGN